jgi:hypothetical protein
MRPVVDQSPGTISGNDVEVEVRVGGQKKSRMDEVSLELCRILEEMEIQWLRLLWARVQVLVPVRVTNAGRSTQIESNPATSMPALDPLYPLPEPYFPSISFASAPTPTLAPASNHPPPPRSSLPHAHDKITQKSTSNPTRLTTLPLISNNAFLLILSSFAPF